MRVRESCGSFEQEVTGVVGVARGGGRESLLNRCGGEERMDEGGGI